MPKIATGADALIHFNDDGAEANVFISFGDYDGESDDDDVFYYCNDEAQLRGLMQLTTQDFVVLSYDLRYNILPPYRYAVGRWLGVNSYSICDFNGRRTFTKRNARKHLVRLLSAETPELYLLTLDNGEVVNSRLYRHIDRRQPCPCCNR